MTAIAFEPRATRPVGQRSDEVLVGAVRAGDDRAFEELYGRYRRRIAAYVYGMVTDYARAEDLTQDVFVAALRRMRETDRPIAFKPWIYEIAKNACIDQFRRSRRAEEVSFEGESGSSGPGAGEVARLATQGLSPDAAVAQKQQLDQLCGAFGGLSDTHHQILVLRELEGLSYREIGERLGLSRAAVESTLFRARRRLTEEYEELATGERCRRLQAVMASAAEGMLGARDRRRLARHLSHCQPCRREARLLGVEDLLPERRSVGARIAALLPLPAFLRLRLRLRRSGGGGGTGGSGGNAFGDGGGTAAGLLGAHGPAVAQWSAAIGAGADPGIGSWGKAAAAAVTIAVAGVGAGVVTQQGPGTHRATAPAAASHRVAGPAGGGAAGSAALSGGPALGGAPFAGAALGGAAAPAVADAAPGRTPRDRDGSAGGRGSPRRPAADAGGRGGVSGGAGSSSPAGTTSGPLAGGVERLAQTVGSSGGTAGGGGASAGGGAGGSTPSADSGSGSGAGSTSGVDLPSGDLPSGGLPSGSDSSGTSLDTSTQSVVGGLLPATGLAPGSDGSGSGGGTGGTLSTGSIPSAPTGAAAAPPAPVGGTATTTTRSVLAPLAGSAPAPVAPASGAVSDIVDTAAGTLATATSALTGATG